MYRDKNNQIMLTEDAIKGLNKMFGDSSDDGTKTMKKNFNQFLTKKRGLCFAD
jgi:hypothetical protein